jgi:hypothetical protein
VTPPVLPHVISARRGRRCPAAAHAGAVCASLRLRCGARPGVASHNSLRELRSLRSNRCDESDHEARCARRPQGCAPRRPRNRRHRAPPAALNRYLSSVPTQRAFLQRRVRTGRSAPLGRRAAQGSWPRAQRELSTDSSHLFERSERSSRSELCDGAARPSSAGKSAYPPTAPAKRCGLPGRTFAAPALACRSLRAHLMLLDWRELRRSN